MSQEVTCRSGAAADLAAVLDARGLHRVLLVTGRGSYTDSGAEAALNGALADRPHERFCDFDENPKLEHVLEGVERFRAFRPDCVVAVGGGSAMDTAKLIAVFAAQEGPAIDYVEGRRSIADGAVPLIAIPTTAGSGSQTTHFAVLYVDRTKFSVAHPTLLPAVALVDPDLLTALPDLVAASAGLDALNQGIESFWSIHATPASREAAAESVRLAWAHLPDFVSKRDAASRAGMALAAQLAGEAIDVTKTTAPHAISYPITSHFGVPHGHAVGLVLPSILIYNAGVESDDCLHPAGADAVRASIAELVELLGATDTREAALRYATVMEEVGLRRDLATLGIRTREDLDLIVSNGFNPQRVNNNPRRLTEAALRRMLEALLAGGGGPS
ncbi:MAG: phosphonoacetaldehyde reductase [Myxococcota bacterium]